VTAPTSRYASRKFLLALLAFITFTVLLAVGKLTEGAYVSLVTIVLTAYLGANVLQKSTAKPTTTPTE